MKKLIFDPGGGLDELQIKVCSFSGPPFLFILIKAHNSVHEITKAKGSSIEVVCFNEGMVPTTNFFHITVLLPSHEGIYGSSSLSW